MTRSGIKILLFTVTLSVFSCGDDDEKKAYSFKDQDLTGEIEGDSWTYADGYVEEGTFDDEAILDVSLFLTQEDPACETFLIEGDEVFFTIPNAVGLYKLGLNSSFEGRSVTLLDRDDFTNIIATEGAVEILTITSTGITGRIDARYDGNNYVNGNFEVSFCPEPDDEPVRVKHPREDRH